MTTVTTAIQAELAKRSLSAGNAVMTRLWMHVKVIIVDSVIITITIIVVTTTIIIIMTRMTEAEWTSRLTRTRELRQAPRLSPGATPM